MGYRIVYGQPVEIMKKQPNRHSRLRWLIAVCFLVFSLCVRIFWQEGASMLQEVLIPGELSITEQAFSQMLMDLRNGESVGDSLTSFCSTVLHETN